MRFGKLEFRPGLWPSLVTLLLLAVLMSLGFWQLDRAEQKRALLAGYSTDRDSTVIQLEPGLGSYRDFNYKLASAAGRYDAPRQFLLDNRTHNGRVGYHVLTPFMLRDSGAAVLVNRGWIEIGAYSGALRCQSATASRSVKKSLAPGGRIGFSG
jgi:surfeit locus 1 family protein